MSIDFVKKTEKRRKNGVSVEDSAKREKYIAIKACFRLKYEPEYNFKV